MLDRKQLLLIIFIAIFSTIVHNFCKLHIFQNAKKGFWYIHFCYKIELILYLLVRNSTTENLRVFSKVMQTAEPQTLQKTKFEKKSTFQILAGELQVQIHTVIHLSSPNTSKNLFQIPGFLLKPDLCFKQWFYQKAKIFVPNCKFSKQDKKIQSSLPQIRLSSSTWYLKRTLQVYQTNNLTLFLFVIIE